MNHWLKPVLQSLFMSSCLTVHVLRDIHYDSGAKWHSVTVFDLFPQLQVSLLIQVKRQQMVTRHHHSALNWSPGQKGMKTMHRWLHFILVTEQQPGIFDVKNNFYVILNHSWNSRPGDQIRPTIEFYVACENSICLLLMAPRSHTHTHNSKSAFELFFPSLSNTRF